MKINIHFENSRLKMKHITKLSYIRWMPDIDVNLYNGANRYYRKKLECYGFKFD